MKVKDGNRLHFYSMRDEFASKAMQVVVIDHYYKHAPLDMQTDRAYKIADEMMKARER